MKTKTTITLSIDISVSNYFKIVKTDVNLSNLVNNFLKMYMNTEKEDVNVFELQKEIEKISNKILEEENKRNTLFIKLQDAQQELENNRLIEERKVKQEFEDLKPVKSFLRRNTEVLE